MPRSKETVPEEVKKTANLAIVGSPAYYENMIKSNPHAQKAYERLMVLYRQQKDYKKELHTINRAIKVFEKMYSPQKNKGKIVNSISNQLNKSLGLVDKKGKPLYEHRPLSTWKKRKEVVLQKLKA